MAKVMNDTASPLSGLRGPIDTHKREAIIAAAREHFSHYGYAKTTVSDLAKAIGFSKAYIYKFFESKQAIGEAICADCLAQIAQAVDDALAGGASANEKIRIIFKTIIDKSAALFFDDRKLHDIAAAASLEKWQSTEAYYARMLTHVQAIILEGRASGEFERKTPLDEVCHSILQVMRPFMDPMMLEHNLDRLPDASQGVVNLVLRSLAP